MKILILEDVPYMFQGIKDVLETLGGVEIYPRNSIENRDLLSDILHHTSENNNYDDVLSRFGEIDLFIIDIYLSQQNQSERNGIAFCEYVLANSGKNNNKVPQIIIISRLKPKNSQLPYVENVHFIDKYIERGFIYETIKEKVKELFQLDE